MKKAILGILGALILICMVAPTGALYQKTINISNTVEAEANEPDVYKLLRQLAAATEAAYEADEAGLLHSGPKNGYTSVDSTATALAGGRTALIKAQLDGDLGRVWQIVRSSKKGKDVFKYYMVVDIPDEPRLRVAWWTRCVCMDEDGNFTEGYINSKFCYDTERVRYRAIDSRTFKTDLSLLEIIRLYPTFETWED